MAPDIEVEINEVAFVIDVRNGRRRQGRRCLDILVKNAGSS